MQDSQGDEEEAGLLMEGIWLTWGCTKTPVLCGKKLHMSTGVEEFLSINSKLVMCQDMLPNLLSFLPS